MKKRLFSMLMALCMLLTLLPLEVRAAEEPDAETLSPLEREADTETLSPLESELDAETPPDDVTPALSDAAPEPAATLLGYKKGDVNSDGLVDASDLSRLMRAVKDEITLTATQRAAGDMDGDGQITQDDVSQLVTYMANGESATVTVCAILYTDGTLVFQNGKASQSGKSVSKIYEIDLDAFYTDENRPPWYGDRNSILVASFKDKIAPASTAYWFYNCGKLTRVDNIGNLNTVLVEDMRAMFGSCSKLTTLDLSKFNTANVTDMSYMFSACSGLTALNVSKFDTANVKDMSWMFAYSKKLTTLDVSKFNTANVTNMDSMFYKCSGLTALNVSKFDTANVTNMNFMFGGCSDLTALDVSKFDTANVTNMCGMFSECSGLMALDVSKFDTANVTDMRAMFYECSGLTALDVSKFNTANVTDMSAMFTLCSGLTELDVSKFNTANVTRMSDMFHSCKGLTELDVSKFNTANVKYIGSIFSGCSGLTELDVSKFSTANVTSMGSMFYGCSGLTALDVSKFNTANVTGMSSMFSGCSGLTTLDVSKFDTANVTDMRWMFSKCSKLKNIYASEKFTTVSVNNLFSGDIFTGCTSLVGGNGTKYSESQVDTTYARIDTASAPGYFTDKNAPTTYKVTWKNYDGTTLKTDTLSYGATPSYSGAAPTRTGYAFKGWNPSLAAVTQNVTYTAQFEKAATDTVYAILYDDGTLTFQHDDSPKSGKTVKKTYSVNLTKVYQYPSYAPWYGERESVRVVNFADKISPTSMAWWFYQCGNLERVDNIRNLDTSNAKTFYCMFMDCSNLSAIDVSVWDTANVTDMNNVFSGCAKLTELDVSKWNTSNVTSMSHLFSRCSGLTELDVSKWDTSKVQQMYSMFSNDSNLSSLDVSGWKTGNVVDMGHLFAYCRKLTKLDVSGWNTSSVTDMYCMFLSCSGLTELDVSRFNTSKVTVMNSMFCNCSALTKLDVSGFDTSAVTSFGSMFSECSKLKTIYASGKFTTASGETDKSIFYGCTSLVGGNGTKYNSSHIDKTYARLDTASAPGYFTDKNAPTTYTVTWKNYDGTTLKTDTLSSGATPSYSGATPVKPSDSQYSYEFTGWNPSPAAVKGNATYTAQFKAVTRTYTVTWKNHDGTTLKTDTLSYGATPSYSGATPAKPSDSQYLYEFTGWNPSPAAVTGNATYTAQFKAVTLATYTVTWLNDDGTALETDRNVPAGTKPSYDGPTPSKPATAQYFYTFAGWTPEPDAVTGNVVYRAKFTLTVRTYAVTWQNWNGTVLKIDDSVPYGTLPDYGGATPAKPADAANAYEFSGWNPAPATATADAIYTATFSAKDTPEPAHAFDVSKDAYAFGNTQQTFGYTSVGPGKAEYPIPASSFLLILGEKVSAKLQWQKFVNSNKWGGNCAGMSGSVALLFADKNLKPSDFGKASVNALTLQDANRAILVKNNDGESVPLSVLTFVEAMQIAQYTPLFAQPLNENSRVNSQIQSGKTLNPLYDAVTESVAKNQPVLIGVTKNKVGGHALLAVGTESVSDAESRIRVYDCNYPGQDRYITLRKDNGSLVGWRYEIGGSYGAWGTDEPGDACSISYVPYSVLETIWENRGHLDSVNYTMQSDAENLSILNYRDVEVARIVNGRLETSRKDIYEVVELSMYWPEQKTVAIPKDLYTFTSTDAGPLNVTVSDELLSASASSTSGSLSFIVEDESQQNSVIVRNATADDTYSVKLESNVSGAQCASLEMSGPCTESEITLSISQDTPYSSTQDYSSLSLNGEAVTSSHIIRASAGDGGSVTPSGDVYVPHESEQTFTFAPDRGYVVASVVVDGKEIGARSSYTFPSVTGEHSVSALFAKKEAEAAAASYEILDVAADETELTVTLSNESDVTVAISFFNADRRFLSARMDSVQANADALRLPISAAPVGARTANVVLLDRDFRPLCDPFPVRIG